jgi:hypothetical protein
VNLRKRGYHRREIGTKRRAQGALHRLSILAVSQASSSRTTRDLSGAPQLNGTLNRFRETNRQPTTLRGAYMVEV